MESSGRCPNCGALVTEGAEWCGLCFARLREPEGEPGEPASDAGQPGEAAPEGPSIGITAGPLRVEIESEEPVGETAGAASLAGETAAAPAGAEPGSHSAAGGEPPGEPGEDETDEAAAVMVWQCPVCDAENPLELNSCAVCGTPFGRLFQEPAPEIEIEPRKAAIWGLIPGMGHRKCGQGTEGFARAALFVASLLMLVLLAGGGGTPALVMTILYILIIAVLVAESALDAYRIAAGSDPVIPTKLLVYGWIGMFGLSVLLVVMMSMGAPRGAGAPRAAGLWFPIP